MIKLYTIAHKYPPFLQMQLDSFKRYLTDDFEFIVFNNANFDVDRKCYNEIKQFCDKNNLQCIDIEKDQELINKVRDEYHERIFNGQGEYINAAIACAYPMSWGWRHVLMHMNDKVCIIDSDMFFVQPDSIEKVFEKYDLMFLEQSRGDVQYMWNGLCFFDLVKIHNKPELDWWCGYVEGHPVDVGGHTHYYLQKYKDKLRIGKILQHYHHDDENCDFHPANYEHYEFGNGVRSILHCRSGSFWDSSKPKDYYDKKIKWLKEQVYK